MESEKIIEFLKARGVTQASIGDNLQPKVRPSTVNQVIHKRQTSRRIQKRICEVIGYPFEDVWKK